VCICKVVLDGIKQNREPHVVALLEHELPHKMSSASVIISPTMLQMASMAIDFPMNYIRSPCLIQHTMSRLPVSRAIFVP
jgi:hypothetical protein